MIKCLSLFFLHVHLISLLRILQMSFHASASEDLKLDTIEKQRQIQVRPARLKMNRCCCPIFHRARSFDSLIIYFCATSTLSPLSLFLSFSLSLSLSLSLSPSLRVRLTVLYGCIYIPDLLYVRTQSCYYNEKLTTRREYGSWRKN